MFDRGCASGELVRFEPLSVVEDQALGVDEEDARTGLGFGEPVVLQPSGDLGRHADTAGARAVHEEPLMRERLLDPAGSRPEACEDDCAGALDVVVEGGNGVGVPVEHVEGLLLAEVLPLQEHVREAATKRLDEAIDELCIGLALEPSMTDAEVQRVVEQVLPVGAHVEPDRKGDPGIDPRRGRVEGELADADRDPAEALIADAENALRVRGDDQPHVRGRDVREQLVDVFDVLGADHQPPRIAVDAAELLDRLSHRGRVDDGHHLLEVLVEEGVELHLGAILQGAQIDVTVEVIGEPAEVSVRALELLFERRDVGREHPEQPELAALFERERGALVEQGQARERHAGEVGLQIALAVCVLLLLVLAHGFSSTRWRRAAVDGSGLITETGRP